MPNYTEHLGLIKPTESEYYNINVPNTNMDALDNYIKSLKDENEYLRAEVANKVNGGEKISYAPILTASGGSDLEYTSRGHYTLIGDWCFYNFWVTTTNIATTTATGGISLSVPVASIAVYICPISYSGRFANTEIGNLSIVTTGIVQRELVAGPSGQLTMEDLTRTTETTFRGLIFYPWQ